MIYLSKILLKIKEIMKKSITLIVFIISLFLILSSFKFLFASSETKVIFSSSNEINFNNSKKIIKKTSSTFHQQSHDTSSVHSVTPSTPSKINILKNSHIINKTAENLIFSNDNKIKKNSVSDDISAIDKNTQNNKINDHKTIKDGDNIVISRKKCPCFGSGGCPFSVDMIKV
jgi:hypothetical protein